jgi:ABC-type protease/lipase transport system fused ATPase/permease subunit
MQAVSYTLLVAAVVAVLLRCYTRVYLVKCFGFDDWCMVFALVSFILFVACAMVGVEHGTGRRHSDLDDDDIVTALNVSGGLGCPRLYYAHARRRTYD